MFLEDGHFVKFYIGSVCIKCKHFEHQERVNIHDWRAPRLPPRLIINIEICARNFKVDIMLIQASSEHMNAWANPAKKINESYAGILLHHNFTSCKGLSWITSGQPPQKVRKAGYMSAFQYVIDIFSNKLNNTHSWSSISKNKMWIIC